MAEVKGLHELPNPFPFRVRVIVSRMDKYKTRLLDVILDPASDECYGTLWIAEKGKPILYSDKSPLRIEYRTC